MLQCCTVHKSLLLTYLPRNLQIHYRYDTSTTGARGEYGTTSSTEICTVVIQESKLQAKTIGPRVEPTSETSNQKKKVYALNPTSHPSFLHKYQRAGTILLYPLIRPQFATRRLQLSRVELAVRKKSIPPTEATILFRASLVHVVTLMFILQEHR